VLLFDPITSEDLSHHHHQITKLSHSINAIGFISFVNRADAALK
jgi:hypothetical protein